MLCCFHILLNCQFLDKLSWSGHNYSTTCVSFHIYWRSLEIKFGCFSISSASLMMSYFIFSRRNVWNLDLFAKRELRNSLADSVNNYCLLELVTEIHVLPSLSANWSTLSTFALTMSEGFGSDQRSILTTQLQMIPFINSLKMLSRHQTFQYWLKRKLSDILGKRITPKMPFFQILKISFHLGMIFPQPLIAVTVWRIESLYSLTINLLKY